VQIDENGPEAVYESLSATGSADGSYAPRQPAINDASSEYSSIQEIEEQHRAVQEPRPAPRYPGTNNRPVRQHHYEQIERISWWRQCLPWPELAPRKLALQPLHNGWPIKLVRQYYQVMYHGRTNITSCGAPQQITSCFPVYIKKPNVGSMLEQSFLIGSSFTSGSRKKTCVGLNGLTYIWTTWWLTRSFDSNCSFVSSPPALSRPTHHEANVVCCGLCRG